MSSSTVRIPMRSQKVGHPRASNPSRAVRRAADSLDCTGNTIGGHQVAALNSTPDTALTSTTACEDENGELDPSCNYWMGWDNCHTVVWDPLEGFAVQLRCNDDNTGRVEFNAGKKWCMFAPKSTYRQTSLADKGCHQTEAIEWSIWGQTYTVPAEYSFKFVDVSCETKQVISSCFGRETSHACRVSDPTVGAEAAYAQCFLGGAGEGAERVLMTRLSAGDVVLSSASALTRVLVNQHKQASRTTATLHITHERGSLSLTPDHVLKVDGELAPARAVSVGAELELDATRGSKVTSVQSAPQGVVNPLTLSGHILAAAASGAPVAASVYPEWIAAFMLRSGLQAWYVLVSPSVLASRLCPESAQAYYDAWIEPLLDSTDITPGLVSLKGSVSAPVALVILFALDVVLAAGLALWVACSLKGLAALLAVAAVAKSRRAKA